MASPVRRFRPARLAPLLALAATVLTGCTVHYTDLSGGVQQAPQYRVWHQAAIGAFLCLASVPGTPIYSGAGSFNPIMGYTTNVVAFSSLQNRRWISIQTYNGLMGWIDGTTIKPFQTVHPWETCIVTIDAAQRPIFHIS